MSSSGSQWEGADWGVSADTLAPRRRRRRWQPGDGCRVRGCAVALEARFHQVRGLEPYAARPGPQPECIALWGRLEPLQPRGCCHRRRRRHRPPPPPPPPLPPSPPSAVAPAHAPPQPRSPPAPPTLQKHHVSGLHSGLCIRSACCNASSCTSPSCSHLHAALLPSGPLRPSACIAATNLGPIVAAAATAADLRCAHQSTMGGH